MENPVLTNTFVNLLEEDSDHTLPAGDKAVSTALPLYGAKFVAFQTDKAYKARLELLAGMMWIAPPALDVKPLLG